MVDDRSTDDTAEIVSRHAAADDRVRLLRGEPLPEGWYGKAWACTQGARAARGSILLFTDADTVHEPALIAHAVGGLERSGADLLTLLTRQELVSFWERAVMPQILTLLLFRYRPAQLNRARRRRDVIANGQFIMVRREAYEAVGTHEAVRDSVAEDLLLAQRFLAEGKKLRAYWAEDLIATRMYTGLDVDAGRMVEEHLSRRPRHLSRRPDPAGAGAAGPRRRARLLAGTPRGAGIRRGVGSCWRSRFSVAFWTIMVMGLRLPPMYGLAYPIGAVMTLVMVARSIARGADKVVWRGREYSRVEGGRSESK